MAEKRTKLHMEEWDLAFDRLEGPVRESLARRMALAGAKVLQGQAQANARVSHARSSWTFNPKGPSNSSQQDGTLADAIYAARNNKQTTATSFVYSVSWNNSKAWWGKLREFGYMMRFVVVFDEKTKMFHTLKDRPLAQPRPMPAHPFLAPAFDSEFNRLGAVMVAEGRAEFPKLMKGAG